MAKIISIPSHIVSSGDDTHYFNLVNAVATKVGTVTRNVNNMEVTDISLNQINTLLGGTTLSLVDTCKLASINQDSYYKPSGVSPYRMGDFAGYNHLAKPSTYFSSRPATDEIDIDIDGAAYKIETSAYLRRGEMLPHYLNAVGAWTDLDVDFELYAYSGGLVGALVDSTTISGVDVTEMRSSTVVGSGALTVPNTDEDYMLYVKANYTNTTPTAIEDSDLHTVITVYAITPYDVDYYVGNWAAAEPLEGATTYSIHVYNSVADIRNAQTFTGIFRATYWWYEDPDGYPSKSYAYGTQGGGAVALYPGGSSSNYETVVLTWDAAIGTKDTTYDRNLLVEYQEQGSSTWNTFSFEHTWTGV